MIGKLPPPRLKAGDELTIAYLNSIRDWVVEGSIAHLGAGIEGDPTPNGWSIGLLPSAITPLFCVLSGAIAASGTVGSGTPGGPLTGQTIYLIANGTYVMVSDDADIWNGLPTALSSGAKCIVLPNGDGTYSPIAISC